MLCLVRWSALIGIFLSIPIFLIAIPVSHLPVPLPVKFTVVSDALMVRLAHAVVRALLLSGSGGDLLSVVSVWLSLCPLPSPSASTPSPTALSPAALATALATANWCIRIVGSNCYVVDIKKLGLQRPPSLTRADQVFEKCVLHFILSLISVDRPPS